MFTDAAALAIALVAVRIGQKVADKQRTYGNRRFEILAAAFNAVLLFVVAGYVLYEGVSRFFAPEPVESIGMLIVASVGLVINLISMRVLAGGKEDGLYSFLATFHGSTSRRKKSRESLKFGVATPSL